MSYDPGRTTPPLTPNQKNLAFVDTRIRGLKLNSPGSSELQRMTAARQDIVKRMSKDEIAAYAKLANTTKSKKELLAEAEAERIAMDANKDKPPI